MTRTLIEKKLQPRHVTRDSISGPLSADELRKIDAYWQACNYLAAWHDVPHNDGLLREALKPATYQAQATRALKQRVLDFELLRAFHVNHLIDGC